MSLLDVAGLYRDPVGSEEEAAALPVLVEHAAAFLAAGGVVTLTEWGTLSGLERAALVAAGTRGRVGASVRDAASSGDDMSALRALAEIDDGEAHDRELLRLAVAKVARSLRGSS